MFERTRKQLTIFFGSILAVIIILITVTYYLILQQTLQKNEIERLVNVKDKMNHQWEHRVEEMKRERRAPDREMKTMEWVFLLSDELIALVNPEGKTYTSPTAYTAMSNQLLKWAQNKEVKKEQGERFEITDGVKTEVFLVSSNQLNNSGGAYWMAIDITRDIELLRSIKLLLFFFTLILLSIAIGLAYLFAGKVMVPLKKSYHRQVEFTTNASHELRTPLSVIHSSVELLEDCKEALPEFEQHVLDGLKDEVERMIRLVESLLTLARSDSKQWAFQLEAVDLGQISHETYQAMLPLALKKGVDIQIDPPTIDVHSSVIQGNIDQLRQLIYILLDNAIKYTPSGGKVTIKYLCDTHSRTTLQITDTGIGIPKDELSRIFERFYRVDKARSREFGGAGLGLSIAADILRSHQAFIHVTSEEGKGSVFEIVFES
ncbi:sensor histidine kinase [Paenibacillus radicis (ex Xue et al. 2023)]|uniref:histidine kinase n=1 Tax=Paenibacillus radicis (ex Xue et al. 2023) TaxID=2972489 RepID=A0ABT1YB60_9BACL|nr:ATP-binding protein [Paenibacillus radicis (ex Xue et al. 2023)]MCR8629990.1 ATP-binding protein [Paenibacillus radicis (ex Xue et al. 2023)]